MNAITNRQALPSVGALALTAGLVVVLMVCAAWPPLASASAFALGLVALSALWLLERARSRLACCLGQRNQDQQQLVGKLLVAEHLLHLGQWEHDLTTGHGYWSPEIYRILGLAAEACPEGTLDLGQVLAAIHPDDREDECTARILASAGVKPYDMQYRIIRPDGSVRVVQARAEVLRADDGVPLKLIGTILDVTDRVTIEQQLRESEQRYRKTFEAAQDALLLIDVGDGAIIDGNDAAVAMYGYPRDDLLNRRWEQLTSGAATRHRRADGREMFVDISCAEADLAGRLVKIVAIRDVTARRETQTKLRLLTRAIEQSPLSVIITDQRGRIEYVNPHFETATGYSAIEVIGRDPSMFKSGYTSADEYLKLWQTISVGMVWQGEFHNRIKSGDLRWESASIGPVRDDNGEITHFVAVKEDITRRKLAEIELMAAKERAEAASLSKSQFLATISHELRTPLNSILGFSEMILDNGESVESVERHILYARHIHSNGTHLLGLINDLLDLSKIEAGKFELNEALIDIEDVIVSAVAMVRSRAEVGCITLECDIPRHLPLVKADDRAMRHLLINLLSNAIKFTPKNGMITVRAQVNDNRLMELMVADTGIGMTEADIVIALEPFGQIDNALSRQHDGTGLGLPLCRSLIEQHGGHLEIISAPGVGTTVTARLPPDRLVIPGNAHRTGRYYPGD